MKNQRWLIAALLIAGIVSQFAMHPPFALPAAAAGRPVSVTWPTITFDDPAITYTLTDFGGTSSSVVLDPAGGSNKVAKIIKTLAAELWAGTTISTGSNFSVPPIPFSATDKIMTMRVWAPAAGIPIRLKVEDASDPTKSCETEAVTTVANAWQTLTFNFANQAPGTAALNLAYTYNKVSVFPNFGLTGAQIGADTTYYFDDLAFAGSSPTTPTPTPPPASWSPITFDDPAITYTLTDFGGTSSSVVLDPAGGSNKVAKIIKTLAAQLWAGTTISTGPNFSVPQIPFSATATTMTMRVWAPAAGIPIRLKVEDASDPTKSCETEAVTTVANAWQTLTFNFANQAPGTAALNLAYTYNKVSVFPNFGLTGAQIGADTTYYFDDLAFAGSSPTTPTPTPTPPPASWSPITFDDPAITYTLTDFGGTSSSVVLDPAGGSNKVAKIIKTLAAELWAGTTISTGPNFSVPQIPFSATATTMTMRVWAPAAGIPIRLKVEDASDPTKSCETETTTTVANAWQTLTFNFANQAPGTAALNLAYTYNKVSVFPYFGLTGAQIGAETTYYFDDLTFAGSSPTTPTPTPTPTPPPASWSPITFDDPAITYTLTDFGGTSSSVVLDPAGGSNKVAKIIKTLAAELWAGTTISTGPNFSVPQIPFSATATTMTMRVWAPAAGIPIRLKVEDASDPTKSCETETTTTVANAWQTLTFNFANQAPGTAALNLAYTYNKVSVFPNFGLTGAQIGAETTYYFDDLTFGSGNVPPVGGNSVIVDDFEDGLLPSGTDPNGIGVGFITWNHPAASAAISIIDNPPAQVPGADAGNKVLREALTIGGGQWAGYTHAFTNAAANQWLSQDWSTYEGVSLWLYGNNTGGSLFLDVMDNRNPGSTTDDAERWSVDIPDNFTGWRFFQFAWGDFHRKDIGNGAPNDGFGRTEIHGYGIGGYGSVPMGSQVYYVDDVGVIVRTTAIDDFEDGLLPSGTDPNGIGVGFITWNHPAASAAISIIDNPPAQVPGADAGNKVLREALTIGGGQWAGYTHAFTNAAANQWLSQDWSTYEGVSLWLYGNNTGGSLFLDVMDNRNPGSTTDDAERWSVDIPDNFTGWRSFQFAWGDFHRKDIGNGAPNDGFGRTEIHGYGIGGYGSVPMGSQVYYVDDVTIYGNTGGGPAPLQAQFALTHYTVTEGGLATISLTLSTAPTQTVTVGYRTAEAYARPNRNYIPTSGSVIFAPDETEKTFTVQTLADGKPSGDQQVMLNLSSVTNAAFGYRRRALLTITDTNAANPAMVDDFEGHHPFQAEGRVRLTIRDIPAGSTLAVPGQGPYEQVLKISVPAPAEASSTASITRTFAAGQNWSGYGNLAFWFYGANSGVPVKVKLLDNQAPTLPPPSQWVVAWSDEFNDVAGSPPDANAWGYELGDGTMNGIPGWGNSEEEFYSDSPDSVAMDGNGNLRLRLQSLDPATTDKVCWYGPCKYTSARLLTKNRTEFRYGRIEARVLVPSGESGLWPAFWSLGTNIDQVGWPQAGEIDIMEYVSRIPTEIFGTIHGPGYSGGNAYGNTYNFGSPVAAAYHTYAVEWAPNEIHWYVDGINYHNATPANVAPNEWVYNHPFYLLFNLAIGGNFGGSISPNLTFPQDMLVDYVRVYQAADTAERFEATFVDNIPGWRQIVIPFSAFTRSAVQPAGAPNDGLTLTNMTGYGFDLQVGQNAAPDSRTFHLDQVHLTITAPTAVTIAETSRTQPAPWLPLAAAMTVLALLVAALVLRRRRLA